MTKIILKIDHREGKIKSMFDRDKLNDDGIIIETVYENLAHGDFQIIIDDKPLFIFERKSLDDLLASIKDGRYKNQKQTLFQSGFTTDKIYYIIEGNVKWCLNPKKSTEKSVHSAIINTLLRDKIGILNTKNTEETYELIQMIYTRVSDDPNKYQIKNEFNLTENETINKVDKQIVTLTINEKTTPDICFRNMLCQIPSISAVTADYFVEKYKTMKNFLLQFASLTKEEQTKQLSEIKINNRKISKKVVENLLNYLFQ